jgi:excisionase family DNA binding protein
MERSDDLITVKSVCDWLHVTKMTVHRWRRGQGVQGFPKPLRIGGVIRFRRRDIEEFLAQRPAA